MWLDEGGAGDWRCLPEGIPTAGAEDYSRTMTIGQRIRELRRERDLTLRELSEATDLSLPFLSDLERDRTPPSLKTLRRVAAALRVTVNDLMHGVEEMGSVTTAALPAGLRDLKEDPTWGPQLDEEWLRTLLRVDHRGRRPASKEDWLELYLSLRRILGSSRRQRSGE